MLKIRKVADDGVVHVVVGRDPRAERLERAPQLLQVSGVALGVRVRRVRRLNIPANIPGAPKLLVAPILKIGENMGN